MVMYQIWTGDGTIPPRLLAIMPSDVMREALRLLPEAMARVERETRSYGVCLLHFNRHPLIKGFGDAVMVSLFDEGRLGY